MTEQQRKTSYIYTKTGDAGTTVLYNMVPRFTAFNVFWSLKFVDQVRIKKSEDFFEALGWGSFSTMTSIKQADQLNRDVDELNSFIGYYFKQYDVKQCVDDLGWRCLTQPKLMSD